MVLPVSEIKIINLGLWLHLNPDIVSCKWCLLLELQGLLLSK